MNLFNIFMAKKKVEEVVEGEILPTCVVCDAQGVEVQTFSNVQEAYAFASENGYSVNISN